MKYLKITISALFSLLVFSGCSENNSITTVQFDEREKGIDPYQVRYLFSNNMLRVDDNSDEGDFVLYDDEKRIIYSVNHDDATILIVKNTDWDMPKFEFDRNVTWKAIEDAPKFESKTVLNYWLSADSTVCTEAQVVEGLLLDESLMLQRYRQTLSSAQVASLAATPEDMRTPCLLIDKVYNAGSAFEKGFPIQQWHKDGLQRMMTTYKENEEFNPKLFELPKDYKEYSIGDNLGFGER